MIVAVAGWRGIGTTTTALLLALELAGAHGQSWLIEADPAGGSLAGRLQLPGETVGALERIAFPTARTDATTSFTDGAAAFGRISVVTAPVDPFRAHACHQPRLPWVPALAELGAPVVVDVGRLRAASPVWPVLHHCDAMVLTTAPEVAAAVGAAEWLRAGGRVSPSDPVLPDGRCRIAVVDAPGGVAFPRATLRADLGEEWGSWLPWEPSTVDLVHRGAPSTDRRLRKSTLLGAVHELHTALPAPATPAYGTAPAKPANPAAPAAPANPAAMRAGS